MLKLLHTPDINLKIIPRPGRKPAYMKLRKITKPRVNIAPPVKPFRLLDPFQIHICNFLDVARLFENYKTILWQDIDKKLSFFLPRTADRRHHPDTFYLLTRALSIKIDLTDTLYRIAEKFNPNRAGPLRRYTFNIVIASPAPIRREPNWCGMWQSHRLFNCQRRININNPPSTGKLTRQIYPLNSLKTVIDQPAGRFFRRQFLINL